MPATLSLLLFLLAEIYHAAPMMALLHKYAEFSCCITLHFILHKQTPMGNKKKQLQRSHAQRSTPPVSDPYIEQRDNVSTPFFILRYVRGEFNKETLYISLLFNIFNLFIVSCCPFSSRNFIIELHQTL